MQSFSLPRGGGQQSRCYSHFACRKLNLQIAEAVSFLSSSTASSNRFAANWPCSNGKPPGARERSVRDHPFGRYTSAVSCPERLMHPPLEVTSSGEGSETVLADAISKSLQPSSSAWNFRHRERGRGRDLTPVLPRHHLLRLRLSVVGAGGQPSDAAKPHSSGRPPQQSLIK
jgi:hypothetical protein